MKRNLIWIGIFCSTLLLRACSENDTTPSPTPLTQSSIVAEPGPGKVTLRWTIPADSNYYYAEVRYVRPDTVEASGQKECVRLASLWTDSMVVDNLLKRYGEIEFVFTTVGKTGKRSTSCSVFAQAEAADKQFVLDGTTEEIELTEAQIYSNAQESAEGSVAALLDDDLTTYFHSSWTGECVDKNGNTFEEVEPHYLVVDFGKEVNACSFSYASRNAGDVPEGFVLWGSADFDYDNWCAQDGELLNAAYSPQSENAVEITEITDGVTAAKTWYYSSSFVSQTPFRYLWLEYNGSSRTYFAITELRVARAGVSVYDPETGLTTKD